MYKKMLSMTVALMLILSVFAAVPVMADFGAVGFVANFDGEEFASGDFSSVFTLTTAGFSGQLVDSVGYDGTTSKVLKVNANAGTYSSDGATRMNFAGADFSGFATATQTYESYDFYYDKANWLYSKPATNAYITIGGLRFWTDYDDEGTITGVRVCLRKSGNNGLSGHTVCGHLREGWNRIVIVRDNPGTTDAVATVWLNDQLTVYKTATPSYSYCNARFQFDGKTTYTADQYVMVDNIKIACTPSATTVSSEMNDATGVLRDTNEITLNFSERVLDTFEKTTGSHDVVPADFVVSGGVEVEEVTVAADRKSVTLTLDRELEYETTYEVSIAENALMDMYSNYITGSVSFTTEDRPAYAPTKPVFKKEYLFTGGEGEVLNKLENGYVSCQYTLTNNTTEDKNALMFIVLWKDGQINGFMFNPQVMEANGGSANLYGGFNVTDAADTKIESYAWESFLTMNPLMPKFTIDKDGIIGTGVIE